ncbi:hypothetical protein APSETT445_003869 [Aspergillus pseudonomiae]
MLVQALDESPIPGYGVQEPSWEVETTPGGPKMILNGTVQQVHAQLLEINPNYDDEFAAVLEKRETTVLDKRDDIKCNNWPKARRGDIEAGIKHLRGVSGQPSNGPGPGNCGRVSCSWGAAIWWCNDVSLVASCIQALYSHFEQNTFTKVLPSFNNIADGAQVILNNCQRGGVKLSGQDFHSDNWNVIVRGDSC